jgi:hypothetical protein
MKYLTFIFTLLLCFKLHAQVFEQVCYDDDSPLILKSSAISYVDISNEPIKHVRVNFIYLRRNDGTGGFQENNSDHQQYIIDMTTNLNSIYSRIPGNYDATCYNGTYGVYSDSKIRFDVNVMYLNNTYAWNNENSSSPYGCPGFPGYHLTNINNQIAQNNPEPAINVFFTEDGSAYQDIVLNGNCPIPGDLGSYFQSISCSEYPDRNDYSYNQSVHMRNKFLKYYWMMNCAANNICQNPYWENNPPTEQEVYQWLQIGRGVAHELAHSFGIGHVSHNTNYDCLDYLMNNTSASWGEFITPIEIAYMHWALSETSMRKYVHDNTYSSTPISITQGKVWNDDIRIYRGIEVENGAKLQILNNLIIPSETEITISDGSILTIENANISTPHTNSVLNISFSQNSVISIENSTITNCNMNVQSSELLMDNSEIELGANGEFVIEVGSEILMTNSSIM